MKLEEIVYDIKHLLAALTDDTRISDAHLIFKINNYRAVFLKQMYDVEKRFDRIYYQKLPAIDVFSVISGDLPELTSGSIKFGKATLPALLSGGINDFPLVDLYTIQKHEMIYFIDRLTLMEMIFAKDDRLKYTRYFLYEGGNDVYIYPFISKITGNAILSNPLDGQNFYTTSTPLYSLIHGTEYIVRSGIVTVASGIEGPYQKDDIFTANGNNIYTGDGIVYNTTQVQSISMQDNYPITGDIAQRIILEILTKDFQLEKQNVFDIINDSADQLKTKSI